MSETPSPRAYIHRILRRAPFAGDVSVQVARIAALERRVAATEAQVAGVAAAVDRLHDTIVGADPELTRSIIEAVRTDVDDLVVRVNGLLATTAQG